METAMRILVVLVPAILVMLLVGMAVYDKVATVCSRGLSSKHHVELLRDTSLNMAFASPFLGWAASNLGLADGSLMLSLLAAFMGVIFISVAWRLTDVLVSLETHEEARRVNRHSLREQRLHVKRALSSRIGKKHRKD